MYFEVRKDEKHEETKISSCATRNSVSIWLRYLLFWVVREKSVCKMIELDLSTKINATELSSAESKVTKVIRFDKKYKSGEYYQYLKHGKVMRAPVEEYTKDKQKLKIKNIYALTDGSLIGVVSSCNKKNLVFGILSLMVLLTGGVFLLLNKKDSHLEKWDKQTDGSNIEIHKDRTTDNVQEYIDFPTYANVVVTEEKPQISLVNFPQNSVNMKYKIYVIHGDDDKELIHESVTIPPDKMEQYNIWSELDAGVYDICYEKYTQDIETSQSTTAVSEVGKLTVVK